MGTIVYDYLELYKSYSNTTLENYRLETVAQHEFKRGKIDYSQYGGLMGLYQNNYDLFLEYNIQDVRLIEELDEKMKYIFLAITIAYLGKIQLNDIHSQVRFWDCYIYNELKKQGIQIPPEKRNPQEEIVGAFVKEPIPQLYSWIVTLDLTSLYPSIIRTFNLSPETLVDPWKYGVEYIDRLIDLKEDLSLLKAENVAMLANGSTYLREKQGIFPQLVTSMFKDRKKFKGISNQASKDLEKIRQEMKRRGL